MHACHVPDTWHASCMHVMRICPVYKNGIGGGKGKKQKRRRKGERKKERKEDMTASSAEFRHSDGRSLLGQELKLATLQEVGIFSYFG